eukprot:gene15038-biopygen12214
MACSSCSCVLSSCARASQWFARYVKGKSRPVFGSGSFCGDVAPRSVRQGRHGQGAEHKQETAIRSLKIGSALDGTVEITTASTYSFPLEGEDGITGADQTIQELTWLAQQAGVPLELEPWQGTYVQRTKGPCREEAPFHRPRMGMAHHHQRGGPPRLWTLDYHVTSLQRKEDIVTLHTAQPQPWKVQPIIIRGGAHCIGHYTRKPPEGKQREPNRFTHGPPPLHSVRRSVQWIRAHMMADYATEAPPVVTVHTMEGTGDRWTTRARHNYGSFRTVAAIMAV